MYIYIYIYVNIDICIYISIYIYVYRLFPSYPSKPLKTKIQKDKTADFAAKNGRLGCSLGGKLHDFVGKIGKSS